MTKRSPPVEYTDISYCLRGCFVYYEFYIDQFFAEHLLTGYFLLSSAVLWQKTPVSGIRLVLGSAAGSAVMCALICARMPELYPLGMAAAGAFVFAGKRQGGFLRGMAALLAVTVCFAGALEALVSVWRLPGAAAMALSAAAVRGTHRYMEKRIRLGGVAEVQLFCGEKTECILGLIDSGNRLSEPLTGRPVSIVNREVLLRLTGEDRIRERGCLLIPYHSIGKEKGWLCAVVIDRMQISTGGGGAVIKKPVLAIYNGQVSAGGQYQMILHPVHAAFEKRGGRRFV